jgi:predicted nucleotidyltransferase
MLELIKHQKQLKMLCSEYNVETLYVFGSASTDTMNQGSDIDLLVRFKKFDISKYFENFMDFKSRLKKLFNRDIDLLEEQSLKNPILIKSINKTKEQVYG